MKCRAQFRNTITPTFRIFCVPIVPPYQNYINASQSKDLGLSWGANRRLYYTAPVYLDDIAADCQILRHY